MSFAICLHSQCARHTLCCHDAVCAMTLCAVTTSPLPRSLPCIDGQTTVWLLRGCGVGPFFGALAYAKVTLEMLSPRNLGDLHAS